MILARGGVFWEDLELEVEFRNSVANLFLGFSGRRSVLTAVLFT